MNRWSSLYDVLHPETRTAAARTFRIVHHHAVVIGLGAMAAQTVPTAEEAAGTMFEWVFLMAALFFATEYLARLVARTGGFCGQRSRAVDRPAP